MISGSLWNYYTDEINDDNNNASNGKSFKYKTKIIGKTETRPAWPDQTPSDTEKNQQPRPDQPPIPPLNTEVNIVLKYFGKFLELSWFVFDKLWSRAWFEIVKISSIGKRRWSHNTHRLYNY